MEKRNFKIDSRLLSLLVLLFAGFLQISGDEKKILVPAKQIKENSFGKPYGKFSQEYKAESENLVLFWERSFGKDPANYKDPSKRFYPDEILAEGERFYKYYADKLKFVHKKSFAHQYKMIIWMFNDEQTTAYGWGDEGVGMMWMRPCRTNSYPYCALAHEMGHSFQYMVGADGARSFDSSPLVEYSSQWMLWQVYPDWVTIEKYHLDAYMEQTHYSLFHETNMYHAPQFMEYWSAKHGKEIISRIWKEATGNEDPISTYKRITGTDQEEFNDEIYDAATHFVTWDLPRIKEACSSYANEHTCKLEKQPDGWLRIAKSRCPQNYGYNAIRLRVPKQGTKVELDFMGLAGEAPFHAVDPANAGWRYGFVAVTTDGKRVYGEAHKGVNGKNATVVFTVPQKTQFLWLVVTGAPVKHTAVYKTWQELAKEKGKEAEWPYQIKLRNTEVHYSVFNAKK